MRCTVLKEVAVTGGSAWFDMSREGSLVYSPPVETCNLSACSSGSIGMAARDANHRAGQAVRVATSFA